MGKTESITEIKPYNWGNETLNRLLAMFGHDEAWTFMGNRGFRTLGGTREQARADYLALDPLKHIGTSSVYDTEPVTMYGNGRKSHYDYPKRGVTHG